MDASDRDKERQLLHQKLAQIRDKVTSSGLGQYKASGQDSGQREATLDDSHEETLEEVPMTVPHKQILTRNRTALVENMVPDDLFRHLVARHTLTSAEERRIKSSATWEDVNNRLLEVIVTRSDSAFTNLVEALRRSCQGHMADLLSKESEGDKVMTQDHKDAVSRNRDKLASDITPDEIFNDLISEHILTTSEVSRIREKATREDKNEYMLDYVIRRCDRSFQVFVESLKKTGQEHLAKLLTSTPPRLERKRKKLTPLNIPPNEVDEYDSPVVSTPKAMCHVSQVMSQPMESSSLSSSLSSDCLVTSASRENTSSFSQQVPSQKLANQILHMTQPSNQIYVNSQSTNQSHPIPQSSNHTASHISSHNHPMSQTSNQISLQAANQILAFSQASSQILPEEKSGPCTLTDVKQQIMLMAENAYANIRRRDDTGEAFLQFSKEMSLTTESINDSLTVYRMIENFCEDGEIEERNHKANEETSVDDKDTK